MASISPPFAGESARLGLEFLTDCIQIHKKISSVSQQIARYMTVGSRWREDIAGKWWKPIKPLPA
jgi:hypothetical protein